ncbi:MAG TPA: peptidyl-prolyl cis-trans isomerase [Holophaga sp.]|nr:peptidyl-prolyl cis-trans isomerase [Holophaga sp.]
MLRDFRSFFKGNQTTMTAIMGIIGLSMLAYLGNSLQMADSDGVAARAYGHDISRQDVELEVEEMAKRLGPQANQEQIRPFLQAQALRQLIARALREELAERHGVVLSDVEVRAALEARLRQIPRFLGKDGQLIPPAEINQILVEEVGQTLALWELEVRRGLTTQKLLDRAAALVPVNEAWLGEENRFRHEQVAFDYVAVSPDTASVADPGDAALGAFLQTGGARFLQPPRRVIQFAVLDKATFGSSIEVGDEAVKAAYESKKAQYTELKASHILLRAESEAQYESALKEAEALRTKLVAKPGDFAAVAEAQSQDPTAKANRGDLGWFRSGTMVKPFEDAAMALKPGEISEPVRTQHGIHLILLEGRRTKSFEEAREELKAQLIQDRYVAKAKERLEQLRKRAGERGDLAAAGKALGLKVETSQPFLNEPGTVVKGLPEAGLLINEAFALKVGQVSKLEQAGERFVVFRVVEEKPAAVPPLAEIRDKVLAAWRHEEARKALRGKGETVVASGDLAALGPVKTQEAAALGTLGELAQHPGIRRALLATAEGQLTPLLWNPDGQLWVARIKTRTPAPALTFESRQTLVRELQAQVSQRLLGAEIQSLEAEGMKHQGFSSFRGRLKGIWINPAYQQAGLPQ